MATTTEVAKTKTETVPVKHAAIEKPVKAEVAHVWDPWKMLEDFREEMEGFWRGARFPTLTHFPKLLGKETTEWVPSTDVYRANGNLVVKADLPGLTKDDVEVLIEEGFLVVKGERNEEQEEKEKEYFRSERSYGSFFRRVPLPEGVEIEKITAAVHDGILEVTVPMPVTPAKEAKKIAVS
jgi:HSP20 family protein